MRLNKLYRPAISHEKLLLNYVLFLKIIQRIAMKVRNLEISVFAKNA